MLIYWWFSDPTSTLRSQLQRTHLHLCESADAAGAFQKQIDLSQINILNGDKIVVNVSQLSSSELQFALMMGQCDNYFYLLYLQTIYFQKNPLENIDATNRITNW